MNNFKSGIYINQTAYKSFQPASINRKWIIDDMQVINLLNKADRAIGRLDMYSEYVDIDLFVRMHIAKEAVQSSKIEGTQTKVEEAFLSKNEISVEKRDDWEEVQNYISAMNEVITQLHRLPFSSRIIKHAHKILLQGVRGQHKQPGEYRRSQNWVGGASLNDAIFIPPVHTEVENLISDLEKFANNELDYLPDLIKIAIIHYQFETIHPFLDGNGRTGRLLITLYLVSRKILKRPILYLSDFFEQHRSLYYDNLMRVRTHNDINQWIKFFLTGVAETAKKGVVTLDAIMQLNKNIEVQIETLGRRSGDAQRIIEYLYKNPIVSTTDLIPIINKSTQTVYNLVADLERLKIISEISGAQRNKLYVFDPYIKCFS